VTVDAFITVPVSLIPTYSILPLFNFVEAGISTRMDNLS
jgi:Na+/H+ antiporter NhaA